MGPRAGLAIFMTVYFGAHTAGSALWGQVAAGWGLPLAHFIAAAGALLAIPVTWRWHLQTDSKIDLTPSLHRAAPVVSHEIENDRGLVLVTVEYRIDPAEHLPFLAALDRLGRERRRDGAYRWGCSRMRPTFHASSRRFCSTAGSSTCASTSGSPMRTGFCRRKCCVSNWRVRRRSRT
jgi:Transmembrane secretion effector